ncbi:MAG: PA14 domain-containing protein [Bdellovibrionales bacterium]
MAIYSKTRITARNSRKSVLFIATAFIVLLAAVPGGAQQLASLTSTRMADGSSLQDGQCAITLGKTSACPNPMIQARLNEFDAGASDPGPAAGPIDVHGWCRYVNNASDRDSGQSYFVPFASAKEWLAFIGEAPIRNAALQIEACARPLTVAVPPDSRCHLPSVPNVPVSAPYGRIGDEAVRSASFQCSVPGECNSCGRCGVQQAWTETVQVTFQASQPSLDGNISGDGAIIDEPVPNWTVTSLIYGGTPPAPSSPPPCNPPPPAPECKSTDFGTACPTSNPPPPNGAHGYLYKLTPIPNPNGYLGVAGSMSLLTEQTRIPDIIFSATQVNIPMRPFTEGFPGYEWLTEWFGFCYTGSWQAPTSGDYTFVTAVDDSVAIWIDGVLVGESNEGNYSPSLVTQNLDRPEVYRPEPTAMPRVHVPAGQHNVRIMYYQGWPVVLGAQIWAYGPGQNFVPGTTPPASSLMQLGPPGANAMLCP